MYEVGKLRQQAITEIANVWAIDDQAQLPSWHNGQKGSPQVLLYTKWGSAKHQVIEEFDESQTSKERRWIACAIHYTTRAYW